MRIFTSTGDGSAFAGSMDGGESNPVKWDLRAYAHNVHPSHHVVQRLVGTGYLVTPPWTACIFARY
jgi:hypothetical protein